MKKNIENMKYRSDFSSINISKDAYLEFKSLCTKKGLKPKMMLEYLIKSWSERQKIFERKTLEEIEKKLAAGHVDAANLDAL